MKHTLKKLTDTKVSLDVTLGVEELSLAKQRALQKLARQVKVSGFRPGKVPTHIAEKHVEPATLANETVDDALNHAFNAIIEAESLRVLDRPSVDLKAFKPYESLQFTAEVEILGAVKLGDYKKLKAKRQKVAVSDADIDEVIERMRSGYAEKKSVDRVAKDGDEVVIDFEGRDEAGELVGGAAGTGYPLTLGSHAFIPGFEEGIVGHEAGETFDLPLTFPSDYHAEALKGAKVTFKTTLQKVSEVVLPAVDDELAKKAGPFTSVAAFRADVKRELTAQKDREADEQFKDDLLGELATKSEIPVPILLVDDQIKNVEQDLRQNLMYRGMTFEQYLEAQGFKDRDDWVERDAREAATRRVKSGLALAELSKIENVETSADELEARLDQLRRQYTDPKVQAQLDTPEVRRDIANRVLTEKTIDRLVEINSSH